MAEDRSTGTQGDPQDSDATQGAQPDAHRAGRRQILMMGVVGASTIISVKPAMAQSAASVLNCEVPVPGPHAYGKHLAADGTLVDPGTPGSIAPPGRSFTGEEVKAAMNGRSLPGTSYEQNQAYVNYIRRLQHGQSGFTCFVSITQSG